jgi:DNA repair protein RecN (Recombination protein N)
VREELGDLGMPKARLEVGLEPLPATDETELSDGAGESRRALASHGADRVELWLAANPGEPGAPMAQAASGGELSRVLLAIKRALLERDPVAVSVFDEVDAGVGGAVGEAIGGKLRSIAEGRQVLCVTHLAQIAAQGHAQLRVDKRQQDGRTVSLVETLSDDERIEEVARMIGGRKLTETTREHAAEMLHHASEGSKPTSRPAAKKLAPKPKPKANPATKASGTTTKAKAKSKAKAPKAKATAKPAAKSKAKTKPKAKAKSKAKPRAGASRRT